MEYIYRVAWLYDAASTALEDEVLRLYPLYHLGKKQFNTYGEAVCYCDNIHPQRTPVIMREENVEPCRRFLPDRRKRRSELNNSSPYKTEITHE